MESYWIFVTIGFLIILAMYYMSQNNNSYGKWLDSEESFIDKPASLTDTITKPTSTITDINKVSLPKPPALAATPAPATINNVSLPKPTSTIPVVHTSGLHIAPTKPLSNDIPQKNKLKLYVNSFNMSSTNPNKTLNITFILVGYTKQTLTSSLSDMFLNILCSVLNVQFGSATLLNVSDETPCKLSVAVSYDSTAAASTSASTIKAMLPTLQTNLIGAGLSSLKSLQLDGTPQVGKAPEVTQINNTYMCSMNYWCDSVDANTKYFLKSSGNVPSVINEDGLPVKNISLVGPESEYLGNSDNILESFTCVWYMKFNDVEVPASKPVIWFQMFAETPNKVILSITNNSASSITVEATIGKLDNKQKWTIPKTTILSNGNNTLYAFGYNKTTNKMFFNIGNMQYPADVEQVDIILGLSKMVINNLNGNTSSLNANLLAFMYFQTPLTESELEQLANFFKKEAGGISALEKVNAEITAQSIKLQNQLASMTSLVSACTKKTDTTSPTSPTTSVVHKNIHFKENPWLIKSYTDTGLTDAMNVTNPYLHLRKLRHDLPRTRPPPTPPSPPKVPSPPTVPQQLYKSDNGVLYMDEIQRNYKNKHHDEIDELEFVNKKVKDVHHVVYERGGNGVANVPPIQTKQKPMRRIPVKPKYMKDIPDPDLDTDVDTLYKKLQAKSDLPLPTFSSTRAQKPWYSEMLLK